MEIVIRKARNGDKPQLLGIFRDASDSLRKSRGGSAPDEEIDRLNSKTDAEILQIICRDSVIFAAEAKEAGLLAGMGALTDNLPSRLIGSTYSRNHFVRASFQHGKAGVSVGRLLREATIAEAKRLGFRRMYGYSTPEAIGFHKKSGAVFYPAYDMKMNGMQLHYYEIELRKSFLNRLRIEPYLHRAGMLCGAALSSLRGSRKAAD